MLDFTVFTTEELEDMLKDHKETLAHMVMISGLSSQMDTIEAIQEEIEKRKDEQKTE